VAVVVVQAGAQIVIEEFLTGEEASFFAFIDGETCIPLVGAQVGLGFEASAGSGLALSA
jgi:phosphoribosylamine-glycine ligase